jgi:hypothetical protein
MIVRGVTGAIIGIAYGFLVAVVLFLLMRPDLQQHNSGLIMIDTVALAWFAVGLAGAVAGICAGVVGLIVGIARLGKGKAAKVGFLAGLLPLGLAFIASGVPHVPTSAHDWIGFFASIAILPVGVALTGIVVAIVADRL